MTRTKRPRKAYRPKPADAGGGLVALARIGIRGENASPLTGEKLTDLGNAYWLAMTNMTTGNASEESWSCVVCALNIGMTLAETVFEGQYEAEFVRALDGAFRAKVRSVKTGSFRFDGDAIQDIRRALQIHDLQMEMAQRKEIVAAMTLVRDRVAAGNVYTSEEFSVGAV